MNRFLQVAARWQGGNQLMEFLADELEELEEEQSMPVCVCVSQGGASVKSGTINRRQRETQEVEDEHQRQQEEEWEEIKSLTVQTKGFKSHRYNASVHHLLPLPPPPHYQLLTAGLMDALQHLIGMS